MGTFNQLDEIQQAYSNLLKSIGEIQRMYIVDAEPHVLFNKLLGHFLLLTDSQFGFVGEILYKTDGSPYLKTYTVSDISWNQETRDLYNKHASTGLEFHNMKTLFGEVIVTGQPVIANDPVNDPRSNGLPNGHPPLESFLGLPCFNAEKLVGMVALANRPGGYEAILVEYLCPLCDVCGSITVAYRNELKRKRVEKELEDYRYHLEELVKERTQECKSTYEKLVLAEKLSAMGRLSASIAHEFNNHLYGILNVLEKVTRRVPMDDNCRGFVERGIMECNRMSNLVKKIMFFCRPLTENKKPIDIHLLIEDIVFLQEKEMAARNIEVERQYAENLPKVYVIEDQIKQVVLNLLLNARSAIPDDGGGGKVVITTQFAEAGVVVRIWDSGCGIPEENLKYIFEPFFSTKSAGRGTGLGLFISYSIIQAHGGNIEVQSGVGKGTTFTIVLPQNVD